MLQIIETFGLTVPEGEQQNTTSVVIGSGIRATGDVEVTNVGVTLAGDYLGEARRESELIRLVLKALQEQLAETRLGLIFIGMHKNSPANLRDIRRRLWDDRCETLTEHGLVLVDISDSDEMPVDHLTWPPTPDVAFDLPQMLNGDASTAAIEDLTRIALDEGLCATTEEALIFGRTLVSSSATIQDLHARLGRAILGW